MREVEFLQHNAVRWQRYEQVIDEPRAAKPDELADMFVLLNDDLAYAQTNYPRSRTTRYLNGLSTQLYRSLYRNKQESKGRFWRFWREELPLEMAQVQKQLGFSFLIFVIAAVIGGLSVHYDESFARVILSDGYVDMTIDNIKNGDPMAVYKGEWADLMFLGITVNNIKVSFIAYVGGLLFGLGTFYMMLSNGLMVGTFQWFFAKYGLLLTSFLTVWIHGALELSAIVIAGCAGFVLGQSLVFPGTYSRGVALLRAARRSTKIIVGLVPIFIVAGFLESFITRLTYLPTYVKATIILVELGFIVFYFVVWPRVLTARLREDALSAATNEASDAS